MTLFSEEKEQGVTDLVAEKASEESALYTYWGARDNVLFLYNIIFTPIG